MLALMLFMFAAFAGGGLANGRSDSFSSAVKYVLNGAMLVLPLSCLVSAIAVIYWYSNEGTAKVYYWYLIPILLMGAYWTFIRRL